LKVLVGSRFDAPKQKVVLTAEKFPNRVENKRYGFLVVVTLVLLFSRSLANKNIN
jgi:hypothetical protein